MDDDDFQAKLNRALAAVAEAGELLEEILAEKKRRDEGGGNVTPLFGTPGEGGNSA